MRSKKRILIIISIAAALLLSAGAISFAAWSGVGSSVSAAGITGSISYINGMTVTSPDGDNNKEKTSITMTKPLYPVDHMGSEQKYWMFELTADISGQLDTLYSISGSLKQGEKTLPAGSAQLYWSESAPTASAAPADSHAFGSGKSYLRDLTVTGDSAAATLYVYLEAFSTEVMNANVVLEFGIAAAQSMTLTVTGHKMGLTNGLSGNATFTNKSDEGDTFNVTLKEDGTATAKVFAPAEYEVVYDDGKDYNSGRLECVAGATAADVTLEYKRFDLWLGWNGADHDMSKVNETNPEIGVNLGADGKNKTLNVISRDSYDDVAVTLWMKSGNSTHIWDVQGLLLKFEDENKPDEHKKGDRNHQYMFLHSRKSRYSDQYQLLWGGNFDGSGQWYGNPTWTAVEETNVFIDPFTEEQSGELAGSEGLRVTIVRRGASLLTYIGSGKTLVQSGIMVLPSEYANDKVKVGFWDYDSKANATWKFEITEDIESIDSVNIPKKFVVPSGSQYGHGSLKFRKTAGEKYEFGEGAQITITPDEGYIMGSLTVSGKSVELDVKDNVYSFAVLDDIASVRATFIKNEPFNNVKFNIPANANANGMKFTLYREINGVTETKSGTVADNSFTLYDVMPGRWNAKTTVYGVDAYLKGVYVGSDNVNVDMTGVFGSPEAINFGSDKVFNGGIRVRYTIPVNIGGDAYFGMKLKSTTDTTKIEDDKARFGLRLFYGGDNGYDTELGVTLVVKSGKWKLQTCGAKFEEVALPDAILSELNGNGVYMGVHRASDGKVHVYMGKNKTIGTGNDDIKEIAVFSSVAEQISKRNIVRFGAAFWGGTFNATVSDLMYSGTSLNEALGIETTEQEVALTVKGRRNGEIVNLNGQIKLTSSSDSSVNKTVTLTDGTAEPVTLKTPLTYNVAFIDNNDNNNQYYDGALTLVKGDTAATVTLEYKRFNMWTTSSPGEEYHDFSKVNDSLPEIGNDGKTLNVISRDSYGDVAASLWMKKGNSTHDQDIQGIFVKFEDGKYMFLRCEKIAANDKAYPGQYKLQWAMNFDGGEDLEWGGIGVQSVIESWKDFVLPLTAEQNTKFESDEGLKVTLVRKGNTLSTYVDDKLITHKDGTVTLPDGYADDKVKVGFWDYDSKTNATWKFDIHSLAAVDCETKPVSLTVNGHKKGATNALSGNVTLTKVIDSGGTNTHTVTLNNGKATVNLITPASYNVHYENGDYYDGVIVLAKGATTATVVLEYRRLELWHGWDGAQHDFSKTNDAQPVIGNNGKTLNVITRDKYGDVSVSLWMKNGNSTYTAGGSNSGVQGIFVKYADGKYMFLRMLRDETKDNKPHRFQWAPNFGSSDGKWNGNEVHSVMDNTNVWIECGEGQYENQLKSTDGLKVTVKRTGNKLEVYLNDELMSNMTQTLPADYGDDQVQVGFWDYDSKANATWRFDITGTLANDPPAEQA